MRLSLVYALCHLYVAFANTSDSIHTKPHIFLVLVDDLGWANLGNRAGGGNGSTTVEEAVTPNIDALVKSGVRLNRHYTYNYCSPSRASLQSGRLPIHVSFNNDDPTIYNPANNVSGFSGIPTQMTGLAEKMKEAGYETHMTGKWDAGMATWAHTPMGKGYDTFYGYYHHANDYYTQQITTASTGRADICEKNGDFLVDLWDTQGPAHGQNGTLYEEELFSSNTLRVIAEHDPADPLFLFHSFHLIHTPLEIPKENETKFSFLKDETRRLYAAMVHYMDTELGTFVDALKQKGMWDNMLMVLSSDNGGPIYSGPLTEGINGGANNIPLKGGKLSDWEGGIRVNAFVSGGAVPVSQRGTELDEYVHIADWYATLCHLAGVNASDERAAAAGLPEVDSVNQWSLLAGQSEAPLRTNMHISKKAYIEGNYKVITGSTVPASWNPFKRLLHPWEVPMAGYWPGYGLKSAFDTGFKYQSCKDGCLYDIINDPYEYHDLALEQPNVLKHMVDTLDRLNLGVFEPDRGNQTLQACAVGMDKYKGFYGPFVDLA